MPTNVLLGASAAGRLAAEFAEIGNLRTWIVLPDGTIRSGFAKSGIEDVAPQDCPAEIAWFSPELFDEGASGLFLDIAGICPKLRFLQSGTSGFDNPKLLALHRSSVTLAGNKAMAPCIAEYVLYNLLEFYQNASQRRRAQAERRWDQAHFRELGQANCVLLGFGTIAGEVARRLRSFGTRIAGVTRSGRAHPFADMMVTPERMDDALAQADIVISSLPLTQETEDSLDAAFLIS